MKFIVVNSVKGGCGKSSISLKLAMDLARETKTEKKKKVYANNVLVIDMDILGSSLRTFVTGSYRHGVVDVTSDFEENSVVTETTLKIGRREGLEQSACWLLQKQPESKNEGQDLVCFTDLFYKKYEEYRNKKIETPFLVCPQLDGKLGSPIIHIAFSSEDPWVKNRFRVQKSNNYTFNINVRYYEEILQKYLKDLKKKNLNGNKITHVIFDMPPNSDPYSDCVFSILLKKINEDIQNKVAKSNRDIVELCVVSSCDLAHINANFLWVKNMYEKNGWQYVFPDKLTYVVNDVTGAANGIGDRAEESAMLKNATLQKISKIWRETTFDETEPQISWNERDDILTLSSVCKSCVAFSRRSFEDGVEFLSKAKTETNDEASKQPHDYASAQTSNTSNPSQASTPPDSVKSTQQIMNSKDRAQAGDGTFQQPTNSSSKTLPMENDGDN